LALLHPVVGLRDSNVVPLLAVKVIAWQPFSTVNTFSLLSDLHPVVVGFAQVDARNPAFE